MRSLALSLLVIAFLVGPAYGLWAAFRYPLSPQEGSSEPQPVHIEAGSSVAGICSALAQANVLQKPDWFRAYVKLKGADRHLRAGDYALAGDLTPAALLEKLRAGPVVRDVRVTIAPGKNGLDVAGLLEAAGLVSAEAFMEAFRSPVTRRKYGVRSPNLEGRLFPDTYRFRGEASADEILEVLVAKHLHVLEEVKAAHLEGLASLRQEYGFDDDDIVTLASIVEEEAAVAEERSRIAGVFLNRLAFESFEPKLLQTDPSITYGCTVPAVKSPACLKLTDRLRTIQLKDTENPYNTYTHEGLPPGPISNPGRAALAAVLAPESHNYLFFVARNDRTHVFSRTPQEHSRAVDRYQRRASRPKRGAK